VLSDHGVFPRSAPATGRRRPCRQPALFNTTPAALPWAAVLLSVAGLLDAAATVRTARAISSDPLQ
jgi:hypothetical protein